MTTPIVHSEFAGPDEHALRHFYGPGSAGR